MSAALALILKNWRIAAVAALIAALVFMYWRLDATSTRLDLALQKSADLEKAVLQQAADIKNANETLTARAKESASMQDELSDIRRGLSEVIKNDEIANAWRAAPLPDSVLEWMRSTGPSPD